MSARRSERLLALAFVAPALAIVLAFVVWPTVSMMLTSLRQPLFTDPAAGRWVGLTNYADVLDDGEFRAAVRNTVVFTACVVPLQTALALLLAVWVDGRGLSKRLLRLCVFLPTTVSLTVLSVLWKLMLAPATATGAGLVNGLLDSAGLPAQPFLSSPQQALPAIIVMSIWQGVGLQMMVLLAGLQQIPEQLYEAARLDGAGRVKQFAHVTLPGVAPTAAFVAMITSIFALKLFVQPYLMTRGGPQGATIAVVQYVYEAAFFDRDLGLACAAAVLFFLGVLAVTLVQRQSLRFTERLT